jgi:hypothetical protein
MHHVTHTRQDARFADEGVGDDHLVGRRRVEHATFHHDRPVDRVQEDVVAGSEEHAVHTVDQPEHQLPARDLFHLRSGREGRPVGLLEGALRGEDDGVAGEVALFEAAQRRAGAQGPVEGGHGQPRGEAGEHAQHQQRGPTRA